MRIKIRILMSLLVSVALGNVATSAARRQIVIEGLDSVPPFEYVENGKATGFNIEVMATVMDRLGYDYTVRTTSSVDSLIKHYNDGEVQVVARSRHDGIKRELSHPSSIILLSDLSVLGRENVNYVSVDSLKGRRVGVVNLTVTRLLEFAGADVVAYPNLWQAISALSDGKVEILILETQMAQYLRSKVGCDEFKLSHINLPPVEWRIVSCDKDLSNEVMSELLKMEEDGTLRSIGDRYLLDDEILYKRYLSWTIAIVLVGAVVVAIVLWRMICVLKSGRRMHRADLARYYERMDWALKGTGIAQWDYDVRSHMMTVRNGHNVTGEVSMTVDVYLIYMPAMKPVFELMDKGEEKNFSRDITISYPDEGEGCEHYVTMMVKAAEYDNSGKVTVYTGIRKDNTDLIKIQKDLEKAKKDAESADKLKSQFLANMSHEIRTPLNAIVGFASLLKGASNEEIDEYVNIINQNTNELLAIVTNVLDMSFIETGMLELVPETFDFAPYFDSIVSDMKTMVTSSEVDLLAESPYESCIINFDKKRLKQIIRIFVTNAIKCTERGHIYVRYKYEPDMGLVISVEDTGKGIKEEDRERIFKCFEKVDDFRQGVGLGLSIVKSLADLTGSKVYLDTKEGEGSTFCFIANCTAEVTMRKEVASVNLLQ